MFVCAMSLTLVALSCLPGCSKSVSTQFVPKVIVAKPVLRKIPDYDEYSARLEPVEKVELRPRVSGYIDNVTYTAGDVVYKGDLLFVIDPRPYQVALDQASAQLRQAEADQQLQDENFVRRQDKLRQNGAIAQEDFDTALTNKNRAAAKVLEAEAAVESAKLNLTFTHITAPISGLISAEKYTVGNSVEPGQILAELFSIDPIYAYFTVDENTVWRYAQRSRNNNTVATRSHTVPVFLTVGSEEPMTFEGKIDYIDPSTYLQK